MSDKIYDNLATDKLCNDAAHYFSISREEISKMTPDQVKKLEADIALQKQANSAG